MKAISERSLRLLFAFGAFTAVFTMAGFRAERNWPVNPTWPYADPARNHWLYQTLSALPAKGARMAIWGWAAHAWVYSGTVPATRESSTEFAWRDWGKNSYYRNRYMESLTGAPPEYFVVAVGPSHFLFDDRKKFGTQTMPGLDSVLQKHFELALDDGETGLLIRRDVFAHCCTPKILASPHYPNIRNPVTPASQAENNAPDGPWHRSLHATEGVVWKFSSPRRANAIVIPFRVGPNTQRQFVKVGLLEVDGSITACDSVLASAPAAKASICIVDKPAGHEWTIVARNNGTSSDDWIEIGRPLVSLKGNAGS